MTKPLKRFLIPSFPSADPAKDSFVGSVFLPLLETHHLKDVLRMKEGAECIIFDSAGCEAEGRIAHFLADGRTEIEITGKMTCRQEPACRISVAQAIPKHHKMDFMAEKASELGIFELIPLVTERTVVRMEEAKQAKALERWQRIAEQTLKQSRLSRIPYISGFRSFKELCENFGRFGCVFIFHAGGNALSVKEVLSELTKADGEAKSAILLVIGPEGGFSDPEIEFAVKSGAKRVSLGEGVLKTDTAFLVASGIFQILYSQSK